MEIDDTFGFLLGRWTLERFMEDRRSGIDGRFEGHVTISGAPSGRDARAHYEEAGTLHLGSHGGPAARHLELVRLQSGVVLFSFTDGKPFVDLDLRSGKWRSSHPCGEEHHEIFTVVRSPGEVEERWRVRGPTEEYDAVATLRRLDEPPESASARRR